MSADDFQNKYASVMESMLRSAVAETRKLFETMVDELREEISSMRKENEELKIRCSRFEKAENFPPVVQIGVNTAPSAGNDDSQRRDSSVQCDIGNFPTAPVEPCQSLQDHQYALLTQKTCDMRSPVVQQEVSSAICTASELQPAEVEHCVVSKPTLNDNTKSSPRGRQNKKSRNTKGCSTDELILPLTDGERAGSDLGKTTPQGSKALPSVPKHSSFTDTDKESETGSKLSGRRPQAAVTRSRKRTSATEQHSEDVDGTKRQKSVEMKQEEVSKEGKHLPVQRNKRGRPKGKKQTALPLPSPTDVPSNLEAPGSPSITNETTEKSLTLDSRDTLFSKSPQASSVQPNNSSSVISSPVQENTSNNLNTNEGHLTVSGMILSPFSLSESNQIVAEEKSTEAKSTDSKSTSLKTTPVKSPQTSEFLAEEENNAVQAVEIANDAQSPQKTSSTQTERSSIGSTGEVKNEMATHQQTPSLSTEMPQTDENSDVCPQITDATLSVNASDQISPKGSSAASTPTEPKSPDASLSQSPSMSPVLTPSKLNAASSRTVIIVARPRHLRFPNSPVSNVELSNIAAVPAQKNPLPQTSTSLVSTSEKPPPPSDLQKLMNPPNTTEQVVSLNFTSTSEVQQLETPPDLQEKVILEPKVLPVESPTSQTSQETRQGAAELATLSSQSSTQFSPTSVESSVGNSKANPKETSFELVKSSKTCSVSKTSTNLVPAPVLSLPLPAVSESFSPMVRLPRLPFSITNGKTVSVSGLSHNGSSERTPQESQFLPLLTLSELAILSSNMFPIEPTETSPNGLEGRFPETSPSIPQGNLTEESSGGSKDNFQIFDELTRIKDQTSLPSESSTVVSATQPSTSKHAGILGETSPTPVPDEELVLNSCDGILSTNIQENKLDDVMQLVRIKSKDPSHPHAQMTKSQFLAQLAVLPKGEDQEKVTSPVVGKTRLPCKVSSIGDQQSLQKNHFLSRLRSYHRAYLLSKRAEARSKVSRKNETSQRSGKLISDGPQSYGIATRSSMSIFCSQQEVLDEAANEVVSAPSSPSHTNNAGQSKDGVGPETTVDETVLINFELSETSSEDSDCDNIKGTMKTSEEPVCTELSPSPKRPKPSSPLKSLSSRDENESISVSLRRRGWTRSSAAREKAEVTLVSPSKSTSCAEDTHCRDSISETLGSSTLAANRLLSEDSTESPKGSASGEDDVGSAESGSVHSKRSISGGDQEHSRKSSSACPKRSASGGAGAQSKESSSVSPRSNSSHASSRSKESSSVSIRRSASGRGSVRAEESSSVNTRSATSDTASLRSEVSSSTTSKSEISGRDDVHFQDTSVGDDAHSTNLVSLRRHESTNKRPSAKITKNVATLKKATSFSTSPERLSVEALCSETTAIASTSSRTSGFSEVSMFQEMWGGSSSSFPKDNPEKECSFTVCTEGAIIDFGSPSVLCPEFNENFASFTKTSEDPSAKKLRAVEDDCSSENRFEIDWTWTEAWTDEARTVAEIKNWKNTKLEVSMSQNEGQTEVKRWKTKGVWVPPTLPPGELPHGDIEKLERSRSDSKNTSPKPKPVRPVGTVSPLQPLSVIGKFTLRNQCGQCGRTFNNNIALENHVSLHKRRRPFSCTYCGKSFADSRALKRHDRVHRNGKIYVCSECGKGFVYNFYLTKHIQMVHSTVRSVFCRFCNKGFFTQREVDVHERSHTGEKPFPCNLCERKFTTRVKLNVHLRWHKGEKRHWCTFCSKGFLDYNNLKRHLLIHTGEKPFTCPLCTKCFSQTGHLKKHVATVHKAK